jgi:hypothetical protein
VTPMMGVLWEGMDCHCSCGTLCVLQRLGLIKGTPGQHAVQAATFHPSCHQQEYASLAVNEYSEKSCLNHHGLELAQ